MSSIDNFLYSLRAYEILSATSETELLRPIYMGYQTEEDARKDLKSLPVILRNSKIFEIDQPLTKLLLLTSNKVRPVKLPFTNVFIDTNFNLSDIWVKDHKVVRHPDGRVELGEEVELVVNQTYRGLLLTEGQPITEDEKDGLLSSDLLYQPNIFISAIAVSQPGYVSGKEEDENAGAGHLKISLYKDYKEDEESRKWRRERNIIRTFVMSFLDFLNDPEVELVEIDKSKIKKSSKGMRLPDLIPSSTVRVTGALKKYVEQVSSGVAFSYSHRFWVRGHFRRLEHPRFRLKRWRKIWVPPFVKGQGILTPKRYKLVGKIEV